MFGIGSESEFALFIAPCKPRDWSSVAPIKSTEVKK
jgi:hypothetical protein